MPRNSSLGSIPVRVFIALCALAIAPRAAPAQDVLTRAEQRGKVQTPAPTQPFGTVSILVNDTECNPLVGAIVDIRIGDEPAPGRVHGHPDERGRISVHLSPPPLQITVTASAPGCESEEREVLVEAGRTEEIELTLHAGGRH